MVGGTAYAAGKHVQRKQEHESEQDEQLAGTQEQEPPPAPAPPPAPVAAAAPLSAADRVSALTDLKSLLDSGVLTPVEFEAEKSKILQGG
jgi:hypothetical protein